MVSKCAECLSLTHETNFQTDTVSSSARPNNATASQPSRDVDENSPSMFVLTGQAGVLVSDNLKLIESLRRMLTAYKE